MGDLDMLIACGQAVARNTGAVCQRVDAIRPGNRSRGAIDSALDQMGALREEVDRFIVEATLCAVNRRNMPAPAGEPEAVERAV
jgi:hypothetical protein